MLGTVLLGVPFTLRKKRALTVLLMALTVSRVAGFHDCLRRRKQFKSVSGNADLHGDGDSKRIGYRNRRCTGEHYAYHFSKTGRRFVGRVAR